MRVFSVAAVGLIVVACSRSAPDSLDAEALTTPVIHAHPTSAATVALPALAFACGDAHAIWFTPENDPKSFRSTLRSWTPECRHAALAQDCGDTGCGVVISDNIIAASVSDAEERAAVQFRHDSNVAAVQRGRDMWKRVKDIQTYALSIRSTPRSLAPACMQRMRADFDRIDFVRSDLEANLTRLPEGMSGMIAALASAKNCVSCHPDLSICDDMKEDLDDNAENFRLIDKLIAADARRLGAKASAAIATATAKPVSAPTASDDDAKQLVACCTVLRGNPSGIDPTSLTTARVICDGNGNIYGIQNALGASAPAACQ